MSKFGAEKGLWQGHVKRWIAYTIKTPNFPKASAKPSYRKGEGRGWLAVANFLVSDPLFLRSGHRSPYSCKPPQKQMLFSVLTSKDKVLRLNFHPPRSRAWVRGGDPSEDQLPPPPYLHPAPSIGPPTSTQALLKRQISAGSSLRAWYSDPAWLSSQGSQEPRTQLALRVLRPLK